MRGGGGREREREREGEREKDSERDSIVEVTKRRYLSVQTRVDLHYTNCYHYTIIILTAY